MRDTGGSEQKRVLDLESIRPRDRYRHVLNAFDAMDPGGVLELTAASHPLPVIYRLSDDRFGQFVGEFIQRDPDWRVRIVKQGPTGPVPG